MYLPEGIRNFGDAWATWWNASEPISRYTLWWYPVFIWARIGKLLEFAGALFFVVDWIGRQNLAKATAQAAALLDPSKLPRGARIAFRLTESVSGDMWAATQTTLRAVAWLVDTDNRVRTLNLALVFVGFVLDLLGS